MKKTTIAFIALTLGVCAQEKGIVHVTGERVSLRAGPEITAVLLDRAMTDDELILKDNDNPDWVGVIPPETIDLWVHRDFLDKGLVIPAKLNVRSGASLSHRVVGVLTNGQSVMVRGETADWVRIAPTSNTTVWISRDYAEIILSEPLDPLESVVEIEETEEIENIVSTPKIETADIDLLSVIDVPDPLMPDPTKEQGIEAQFSGILYPTDSILYRLMDSKFGQLTVCYVRGNRAQMNAFAQLPLKLTGKSYWAKELETPILVPQKLEVLTD